MVERVYWDTDAFLGLFQQEESKVDVCRATIERATAAELVILTSALTIAEVLWPRGSPRLAEDKAELLNKFFRRSFIRVRNVTRKIAADAQMVVWTYDVKPKDAIH